MCDKIEAPEMTRTQLWKRARELMKAHEIMDGSGHLYLKNRGEKVTKEQTQEVIAFVHEGLAQQGIDEEKAKTIDAMTASALHGITRRGPAPEKKAKPKKPEPQQKLTLKKANPRTETRQIVIQVTVKKARNARNFHYPRDLPAGDL